MTGLKGFGWATLAAMIAGAVVAASAIGWGLWRQQYLEAQSATSMRSYQQVVHRSQLLACPRQPMPDARRCIAEANSIAWEHARVEGNLLAQRITALWTQVMGVAAVSGMLLSAIGVGLVWSTFQQTRRAADAAHENLRAFVAAEDALLGLGVLDAEFVNRSNTLLMGKLSIFNFGKASAAIRYLYANGVRIPVVRTVSSGTNVLVPIHIPRPPDQEPDIVGRVHYETSLSGPMFREFNASVVFTSSGGKHEVAVLLGAPTRDPSVPERPAAGS